MKDKTIPLFLRCFLFFNFITITCFAQNIGEPYPDSKKIIDDGIKLYDNEKYDESIQKYLQVK